MKASKTSPETTLGWRQISSIFVLPAIGLYLVAYRLLGKRCTYHWGNFDVTPLEPITKNEYLFTRLFPASVVSAGILLLMLISYFLSLPLN